VQFRPLIAVLIAGVLTAGAGAVRGETVPWGAAADTLKSPVAGERITLRSAFIVPGSVHVELNGAMLAPETYQINHHLGTIRFRADIPPGAIVIVSYQRQPVLLSPVYSLRPAEVSRPDSVEAPPERVVTAQPAEKMEEPRLVFGGTKSVSFSTGTNRGQTFDQSLEATVEGQLTPTIRVRALLSDNNLPIQPEGNTEELQYFDRVFMEIEGPNARTALGDIALDDRTSSFSPLTRQLRGFSGAAWNRMGRVVAAGAQTKGQFRTVTFRGTTGLQGPYSLLSQARTTRDVVIAGTERVYVNGARMERGQNQDYVIDYDAGTITFTPRRLITTDTEIAVDYEVTQVEFERSTVLSGVEDVPLGGGVQMSAVFAREADDGSRPRSTVLSEEDIRVLAAAGDDPALAITGGVAPADSGKGTYVLVPADSVAGTPDYYRFDELRGNLIVSFVEVGEGAGDYRRAGISSRGIAYYEFTGAGAGTYRVGRQLPLPSRLDVATMRVGRARGDLTFDAEWNVSDHDRNRFSPLDDGNNLGQAGQARIGIERGERWRLGLSGSASVLEDRFSSFDRARPWYYYRDWNLEDVPLTGREVTSELAASAARGDRGGARYSLARLDRPGYEGVKDEAVVNAGRLDNRGARARGFITEMKGSGNERTRRHLTVEAAYGVWRVVPGATYSAEHYLNAFTAAPDSGRAYELTGASLSSRTAERLVWRLHAERRDTRDVDPASDAFRDTRRDDTMGGMLTYRSTGAARAELQITHSREEDRVTTAERSTDLARLKAAGAWDAIGLRVDADYEVSQTDAATLQRSVIFVGDGKGDYNELGEPVGKGKGSYTVVYLPTPESTPVHTVGFNLRVVWKPGANRREGRGAGAWILRNVSLEQTLGIREESTYDPAWKVYLMVPSVLQRDDATVFGTSTLRQDWSFLDGYRNVSLTYRYLREDQEDNRFEGVRESSFAGEHVVRFTRSLSQRLSTTLEAGFRSDRRGGTGIAAGTGSAYDVNTRSGLAGVGITLVPGATLDIDLRGTRARDDDSGAEQTSLRLSPRLVWRVAEQVNVFGTYELADVKDRNEVPVRPIIFAREGRSHRWSVTPNVRISRIISIFATYSGRNEVVFSGRRITEHEFRLETRAYF